MYHGSSNVLHCLITYKVNHKISTVLYSTSYLEYAIADIGQYLVGQHSALPDANFLCQTTLLEPPVTTTSLHKCSNFIEMNTKAVIFEVVLLSV